MGSLVAKVALSALVVAPVLLGCSLTGPKEWSCSTEGRAEVINLERVLSEHLEPVAGGQAVGECDSAVEAGVESYLAAPTSSVLARLRSIGCSDSQEVTDEWDERVLRSVCLTDGVWFLAEVVPEVDQRMKNAENLEVINVWFTPIEPPQRFSN